MITDCRTNFLYLADTLPKNYPRFYERFRMVLDDCGIPVELLPGTGDVWAVDYMPVQVDRDRFLQFQYDPSYLYPDWQHTRSDVSRICKAIDINPHRSPIKLDGGNVVTSGKKVILTKRVFRENPSYTPVELEKGLKELLEVEEVIFIPEQPYDFTGHADGMVRFLDDDTVLVNDYSGEGKSFRKAFHSALENAGLECVVLPYNPYGNEEDDDATGCYINYLQTKDTIIVPLFGLPEDEKAVRQLEEVFTGQPVIAVDSKEIAKDGGVLNCISWNILKG